MSDRTPLARKISVGDNTVIMQRLLAEQRRKSSAIPGFVICQGAPLYPMNENNPEKEDEFEPRLFYLPRAVQRFWKVVRCEYLKNLLCSDV